MVIGDAGVSVRRYFAKLTFFVCGTVDSDSFRGKLAEVTDDLDVVRLMCLVMEVK